MTFTERLQAAQKATGSMLCVGLDTDLAKLPPSLLEKWGMTDWRQRLDITWQSGGEPDVRVAKVIYTFNVAIIEATRKFACAFKPNLAFYEQYGLEGLLALYNTLFYLKGTYPQHVTILDGKRNDIGNTAEAYANAYFKYWGVDAGTVNPYMGCDTLQPFFESGKGVIPVCKTSNPGSGDFQDVEVVTPDRSLIPLYFHVADTLMRKFGQTGNLGLVVGATFPVQLKNVRHLVGPDIPILIPAIGKQGGNLAETTKANNGGLAVINLSRDILYASSGEDWAEAAGRKAKETNEAINALR